MVCLPSACRCWSLQSHSSCSFIPSRNLLSVLQSVSAMLQSMRVMLQSASAVLYRVLTCNMLICCLSTDVKFKDWSCTPRLFLSFGGERSLTVSVEMILSHTTPTHSNGCKFPSGFILPYPRCIEGLKLILPEDSSTSQRILGPVFGADMPMIGH